MSNPHLMAPWTTAFAACLLPVSTGRYFDTLLRVMSSCSSWPCGRGWGKQQIGEAVLRPPPLLVRDKRPNALYPSYRRMDSAANPTMSNPVTKRKA